MTKPINVRPEPKLNNKSNPLTDDSFTMPCVKCKEYVSFELDGEFTGETKIECPNCKKNISTQIKFFFEESR